MTSFPLFFENAVQVGFNIDQEPLAVGVYHGTPWLARLDAQHDKWITVRPASQEEIEIYDSRWLNEIAITNGDSDDTRTKYHRN